jgi:hypothetical protein
LTRRIDRRGLVREFQYDTLGRNTAEIWYDTAADAEMHANRHNTLSFTYDAPGRMLAAGDQFASDAYAYDRSGRMISIRQSAAHVDADLRDAIPPASEMPDHAIPLASEMPDHANILPVAEKRVDFTCDSASQPSTLTR